MDLTRRNVALRFGMPGTDGVEIEGLTVEFRQRRTLTGTPDHGDITALNLDARHVQTLLTPGVIAQVLAGYGDSRSVVVSGSVVAGSVSDERGEKDRGPATSTTSLQVRDGGLELADVQIAQAWAGAVRASEVLDYVIAQSGLSRGVVDLARDPEFPAGYVVMGRLRRALDDLARACGCRWSIRYGVVDVWPVGRQATQTTGPLISWDSGLVGQPRQVDAGRWEVVSLLRPEIRPGDRIRVTSTPLDGDLLADEVEHAGISTYGSTYYTTIVGQVQT